jgi:hypothetical protein
VFTVQIDRSLERIVIYFYGEPVKLIPTIDRNEEAALATFLETASESLAPDRDAFQEAHARYSQAQSRIAELDSRMGAIRGAIDLALRNGKDPAADEKRLTDAKAELATLKEREPTLRDERSRRLSQLEKSQSADKRQRLEQRIADAKAERERLGAIIERAIEPHLQSYIEAQTREMHAEWKLSELGPPTSAGTMGQVQSTIKQEPATQDPELAAGRRQRSFAKP